MQTMDGSECVEDTMNRLVNEAQKYNNFDIGKKGEKEQVLIFQRQEQPMCLFTFTAFIET